MNTSLPASIEAYLKEAGFSQTEMLILRRMLEDDTLTVRELGTKTGKSPGVVDQAMKKLISKRIIRKENINGHPRYFINSLDAIVACVQKDMQERKANLERRHESFSRYIATLKMDQKRPDMEHFSGLEGVKQAYEKLIGFGTEIVTYTPILHLAEDDPLRAFHVDYFRTRQARKIFHRVIAPDTPLARRFQSRDPFEYRKTLLVPEKELPMVFEKSIAGDIVAYIDPKGTHACLFRFTDLAKSERATFDALWNRTLHIEKHGKSFVHAPAVVIPLRTRILSCLREFFLGKRSIAALILFALCSAALTFGLYKMNRKLNLDRLQDRVLSIASTGALQFDAADVNAIWKPEDIAKPQYAKLIATLNLIRRNNSDIQYAYIMRKTDDPTKLAFVADADSLFPNQKKDLNKDGKIDDADALNIPGELYEDDELPLISEGFKKPFAGVGSDKWGTFIAGAAAIRDSNNNPVAVLGVDMFADNLDRLSAATFSPLFAFIGFFFLFMLIRFWSENKSLLEECLQEMRKNMRKTVIWTAFILVLIAGIVFAFYEYRYQLLIQQKGEKLMAIAATAAAQFDPKDFEELHWAKDMQKDAYQRVFKKLNEIRNQTDVKYAYIVRPTDMPEMYEFIADADSNYSLPLTWIDHNVDGVLDTADNNIWPGVAYFNGGQDDFERARFKPAYGFTNDQWGQYLSGLAPIYDSNKNLVAFLGLDAEM